MREFFSEKLLFVTVMIVIAATLYQKYQIIFHCSDSYGLL